MYIKNNNIIMIIIKINGWLCVCFVNGIVIYDKDI